MTDAVQGILALLFAVLYGGQGNSFVVVQVPPRAYYWEVTIYGAADIDQEFPLALYYAQQGSSEHTLIGGCGAPVHQLSGSLSQCMTTMRFRADSPVLVLHPVTEYNTDWVLEYRTFLAPHEIYLPYIQRTDQPRTVSAQGYP